MLKGCFTALVTPFTNDQKLDQGSLEKLIEFQVTNGISGVAWRSSGSTASR